MNEDTVPFKEHVALAAEATEHLIRIAAKDAEIARLLGLLQRLEPHLDAIVCYARTMDEHAPNRIAHDVRAALSGSPAPDPAEAMRDPTNPFAPTEQFVAEAMRAKCEAIAREASEEHDGFGAYEPTALRIADAIAALKGKGEGK